MVKVAFFVDAGFLRKRIFFFKSFFLEGATIREYCLRHLREEEKLYRIFYYDAPPLDRIGQTPFGEKLDFSEQASSKKAQELLESIRETPNMALRLGRLSWQNDWVLKPKAQKRLIDGDAQKLADDDFTPNVRQKAVDMKIGLDIATIAFKKLADRVVLIAGDSDFSPAAKLARTEGLHVTLDPLGNKVPSDLLEHIDDMCTRLDIENSKDVDPSKKSFFVPCKKTL